MKCRYSPNGEGLDPQEGDSRGVLDVGGGDIAIALVLDQSCNEVPAE